MAIVGMGMGMVLILGMKVVSVLRVGMRVRGHGKVQEVARSHIERVEYYVTSKRWVVMRMIGKQKQKQV
jgi:hypothetical protein